MKDNQQSGEQLRDLGAAQAESAGAVQQWCEDFDYWLHIIATSALEYDAEDVVVAVRMQPKDVVALSNNSVGARILAASKRGLIVKVGYRKGQRKSLQASAVAVWKGATKGDN